MKGPCIIAGDLSEAELHVWLRKKAAQAGGLDGLALEITRFKNSLIPGIEQFADQLRTCINGLTSTEVCRTEDSAKSAQSEAELLEKVEQSLRSSLHEFKSLLTHPA